MIHFFKYIALIAFNSIFILGCNNDNDDIVKPNDVINLDLENGIWFGLVNRQCAAVNRATDSCNEVFKYTGNAIFKTNISEGIPLNEEMEWTYDTDAPLDEVSLFLSKGIENLPRGLRDFNSTSITEFEEKLIENNNFYIFEYQTTNGARKTIQFEEVPPGASEEVKIYFNEVIKITRRLSL